MHDPHLYSFIKLLEIHFENSPVTTMGDLDGQAAPSFIFMKIDVLYFLYITRESGMIDNSLPEYLV
jgi:hypothetical protein